VEPAVVGVVTVGVVTVPVGVVVVVIGIQPVGGGLVVVPWPLVVVVVPWPVVVVVPWPVVVVVPWPVVVVAVLWPVVVVVVLWPVVVVVVPWPVVVVLDAPDVVSLPVHDSLTDVTACVTGSGIADSGVPGGTLTTNVNVCPLATVTVRTHPAPCAPAIAGSAAHRSAHASAIATARSAPWRRIGCLPAWGRRAAITPPRSRMRGAP
jgi:hypothetical protein